jgi:hypothetical protein
MTAFSYGLAWSGDIENRFQLTMAKQTLSRGKMFRREFFKPAKTPMA